MSKIKKLIAQYCPEGVEWKTLGDVVKITTGQKPNLVFEIKKFAFSYINAGLEPSGSVSVSNTVGDTITIPSRGQGGAGYVGYQLKDFWCGPLCYRINSIVSFARTKFIFYYLKENQQQIVDLRKTGSIPAVNKTDLSAVKIPIPPLPVQEEIVNILDKFTALEGELEGELEARKHQYEYYRNQLLSFEGKDVEWKTLGEVCLKTNNIKWKENVGKEYNYIDLSAVNRDNNQIEDLQIITSENAPSRAQQIVKTDDIIFGTTRPTLKRYAIVRSDLDEQICSTGFCVLRPNQNLILPNFLFFILKSQLFFNYVENNQEGAGYPAISNTKVKNFQYPVPSLEEQERIVAILDKFDALVNDISVGLPAEIAARRQQYEYYRRKLLTFEPLAVAQ